MAPHGNQTNQTNFLKESDKARKQWKRIKNCASPENNLGPILDETR